MNSHAQWELREDEAKQQLFMFQNGLPVRESLTRTPLRNVVSIKRSKNGTRIQVSNISRDTRLPRVKN